MLKEKELTNNLGVFTALHTYGHCVAKQPL